MENILKKFKTLSFTFMRMCSGPDTPMTEGTADRAKSREQQHKEFHYSLNAPTNTALIFAYCEGAGGGRHQILDYNSGQEQWRETLSPFPTIT